MTNDVMKTFESLRDANQGAFDSLLKINESAVARFEKLIKLNNDLVNEGMEDLMAQLKTITETKKPEEMVNTQVEFFNTFTKKAFENSQKYFDLLMETNNEVSEMVKEGMTKIAPKAAAA